MKLLRTVLLSLLSLIIILSPLIMTASIILFTPKVYENTIYGELDDKLELLEETEGERIIVIGCSSVPFGLDSETLSSYMGKPVIDFGLYAAVGTKAMLDLSEGEIRKGDTVILAPELDSQTLSMYFSAEHILPAIDEKPSMLFSFGIDNIMSLIGGSFAHAGNKLKYKDSPLDPTGIYNKNNFNSFGDIKLGLREGNIMQLYYDPTCEIRLSEDILDGEFTEYLNEYIEKIKKRGAEVYFSYCPMNEAALSEGSLENAETFENILKEKINCDFISEIENYIYDKAYFYDTNFHLNDTGVKLRTARLAQDLLIAEGIFELVDTEILPPPLPDFDIKYFGEEDENSKYFTFETMENGAYMISGLTEEGRSMEELVVPLGYNGIKVTAIGERAFASGDAHTVTVTSDTNLRNFLDGAFDGSDVYDLYIYYDFEREEDKLAPCADFGGISIHVTKDSSYITHYDWLDSSGGYYLITDIEN